MKKRCLFLAAGLAAAAAVPIALLAPGRASGEKKAPFLGRNFAHRGLHTPDKQVPENSLAAFRAAVENGYGMELDVQLSKDGQVVVFHDDNLLRVCGREERVDELTLMELRTLSLCGTGERIPVFSQVLKQVGGRTPLIVELKSGPRNTELCEKTLALLRDYDGDFCVESFDPRIVAWFRRNAPDLLRGQLSQPCELFRREQGPLMSFLLSHTLLNFLGRPQFIAYKIGPRPALVRLVELFGAMRVGWTSHGEENEKGRDAVIFEFYHPRVFYR